MSKIHYFSQMICKGDYNATVPVIIIRYIINPFRTYPPIYIRKRMPNFSFRIIKY